MYEYEIENKNTLERTFVWGGSYDSAMSKSNKNKNEWTCLYCERIED